jgi:hypothetical protein
MAFCPICFRYLTNKQSVNHNHHARALIGGPKPKIKPIKKKK